MAFGTTRWSLVVRARSGDAHGRRALDELCAIYWPAVYALYRREGLDADAAGDVTQALFADLLERGDFANATPERGRFRAWLCTCARHFLSNARASARAGKRGGGRPTLSLDVEREEGRLSREPLDHLDPAAAFERRWAQTVIETALRRLAGAEVEAGREALFAALRPTLEGASPTHGWAALAAELGSSEGALRVAAHRLRGRFRDRLLAEVRETLDDPAGAGDEIAELMRALQAGKAPEPEKTS